MMNEYNEKTAVRTRRTPFRPAADGDTEQSMNVLPVGTHLGEFEILELIGEGGFGIVYLAYDHSLERHVALKEYMPSGLATRTTKLAVTVRSQRNVDTFTTGLKSFINEARMLAQFDSPSLVKVHRFWEGNGTAYMVMPFYEGITLKQALKEHRIAPTEAWIRVLLSDLCDAIETIHSAHCLHRDIAPDNILLLKDGRPLLLDFGAARRVIGDLTQRLTVILKPGFAPIEQYANSAGLRQGAWTDIYALAGVVYYLITGKAPPPAVARMVHDEMVPAREAGKGRYSNGFLAALDKALAVKPEQRFRSIDEMRRALGIMETVPRTLPHATSEWSTTVARTAAMAEPDPAPPEPHYSMHADPLTRFDPSWQKPPASHRPQHGKPTWIALTLLLSAGIAAGVYWGTQRPWDEPADTAAAVGQTPQSSGSGELDERDTQEQAAAPAPADTPARDLAASLPAAGGGTGETEEQLPAKEPDDPPAPRLPSEVELWRMASTSGQASAYEDYLSKYPDGRYAALARLRLERMQQETATAAQPEAVPPKAEVPDTTAPSASASGMTPRSTAKTARPTPPSDAARIAAKPPATPPQAIAQTRSAGEPSNAASGTSTSGSSAPGSSASGSTQKAAPGPATAERADDEMNLWDAATSINEAPAYEAYLNLYPKGRYAPLAKDRLASMKAAEPAKPARRQATEPQQEEVPQEAPPQKAETAPPEPALPPAEKLASIKPSEPAPSEPKPSIEAPPPPQAPAASSKKSITLADQTMIGDFSADPRTGIVSGTGKIVWNNGNQFEGTLVRGVKQGKGKFIWSNGQRYTGDWARDMPNGKGTIVFANGNRYEGDVKDGMPHGQGTSRFKDGDVYTGTWVRGKSHGHGRYTWANGSYWEGEFRDDKRTENGKLVFSEAALQAARNATGNTQSPVPAAGLSK